MAQRPQVAIADETLTVEPGRRVSTRVKVRNTGRQVAHYRISCVEGCVPAAWATIPVPEVKLNPGADTDVVVQFEPPLDTRTQAGTFPFGIRVRPGPNDGQQPMVGEGDLTVGAITAIDVRLSPKSSSGRFNGKHRVLLDNTGTEDLQVRLRPFDDDEALSAAIVPQTVNVPAGGSGEALLRVRGRTPKVVGKAEVLPFHVAYRRRASAGQVMAKPADGGEVEATVDGSYRQKPVVAKWMLAAGALAAALGALLVTGVVGGGDDDAGPEPPLAPANLLAGQQPGNIVQLAWETRSDVETVRIRRIACATRDDPVPDVLDSDFPEAEITGSRTRTTVGPFDDVDTSDAAAATLCFQARSVTGDEAVSVWSPQVAEVTLDSEALPIPGRPVVEAGPEPGTAEVTWEAVDAEGDLRYDLIVDGRSHVPDFIVGTAQSVTGLAAGERRFALQAVGEDGTRSALSEEATLVVETGAGGDGDGDGGGGGGGPGGPGDGDGPGTSTPDLRTPDGSYALILLAGATEAQHVLALDVARGVGGEGEAPFPDAEDLIVGETIELPGFEEVVPDGARVVIQDGFESVEAVEERCAAYAATVERLLTGALGPASGVSPVCHAMEEPVAP